jgi:hypothetical protein
MQQPFSVYVGLAPLCFEDRAGVYDSILHTLDLYGRLEELATLLGIAERGFPTRIPKGRALELVGETAIKWLADHEIITPVDNSNYGLVDEFLRIRFILSEAESAEAKRSAERSIIRDVSGAYYL